jgi:hypothetical protein
MYGNEFVHKRGSWLGVKRRIMHEDDVLSRPGYIPLFVLLIVVVALDLSNGKLDSLQRIPKM